MVFPFFLLNVNCGSVDVGRDLSLKESHLAQLLSRKNFPLDSQVADLYIPMTKQTLNRDGMVTSVEFSSWGRSSL